MHGDPSHRAAPTTVDALYEKAVIVDALASPTSWNIPYPPPGPLTAQQLDNARASGITVMNLTVSKTSPIATVREIGFWLNQIETYPEHLMLVRRYGDIARAKHNGRLGLVFGFQGLDMIDQDLDLIDTFANLSVKIMQVTYNDRNALGGGSSVPVGEGLTPLGHEAIARMNSLGVVVDASHANPTTAMDIIRTSIVPVAITHTGARAIFDNERNAPDDVLHAAADSGGVVGAYLMPFLGKDPIDASKALFMKHLAHMIDVCGEDHVGIGTDQSTTPIDISPGYFDAVRKTSETRRKTGRAAPGETDGLIGVAELNSARRVSMIAEALDHAGYPIRVIEKIIGGNFDRLFKTIWQR